MDHVIRFLTALEKGDYLSILSIVKEDDFDVNLRTNMRFWNSMIDIALRSGPENKRNVLVKTLLEMGADPNALLTNSNTKTLLDYAIECHDEKLFSIVLADPRTRFAVKVIEEGNEVKVETPLSFAEKLEHDDFVAKLKSCGHMPAETFASTEILDAWLGINEKINDIKSKNVKPKAEKNTADTLKNIIMSRIVNNESFERDARQKAGKAQTALTTDLENDISECRRMGCPLYIDQRSNRTVYLFSDTEQKMLDCIQEDNWAGLAKIKEDGLISYTPPLAYHKAKQYILDGDLTSLSEMLSSNWIYRDWLSEGTSLFATAIFANQVEIAKYLAENFPVQLTAESSTSQFELISPLKYAREQNNMQDIVELIKKKQTLQVAVFKEFLLREDFLPACQNGEETKVESYLENESIDVSDIYFLGEECATPLMAAAAAGQEKIVNLLLEGGADPYVTNNDGKTAMDFAQDNKFDDIKNLISKRMLPKM